MKILRKRLALTLGAVALSVSTAPMASAFPIPFPGPHPLPVHDADLLQAGQGYYQYWDAFDVDPSTLPPLASAISAASGDVPQIPYVGASIKPQVGVQVNGSAIVLPSGGGNGQAAMDAHAQFEASLSFGALGKSINVGATPSIEAYASYARGSGGGTYRATVTGYDFNGAIHHYVDSSTTDPIAFDTSYSYVPPAVLPSWSFATGIGTITVANFLAGHLTGRASGSLNVVGGGSVSVSADGEAIYDAKFLMPDPSTFNGDVTFVLFTGPLTGNGAQVSASTSLSARTNFFAGSLCGGVDALLDAEQLAEYSATANGNHISVSKSGPGVAVHPPDYSAHECVAF
jgi:hypothetical protein